MRGKTEGGGLPSSSQTRVNNNQKKKFADNGSIFILKEPINFRNEIQEIMKQNAGIIREHTKLQNGLKRILELKREFYSNKDNITNESNIDVAADNNNAENVVLTWQVKSSLIVCEAIIRSALMRQESRGAHYRSDFRKLDDQKWKVNIYCRKEIAREKEGEEGTRTTASAASAASAASEMTLFKQNVKEIKRTVGRLS